MRAYTAQLRAELALSLRQGEQLLVSVGIPLLLLVFFSLVDVLPKPAGITEPVDFLTPGVLALAIMSSAMVSLGIGTGFERHYKVLKRLGVTPLGRGRLVGAKISMVVVIQVIQVALVVVVAVLLGWRAGGPVLLIVPGLVLGTAAFAGLGLLLAGTLSGPLNLAVCNGLYLVLLLFGGMVIPLEKLPGAIRTVAEALPAGALAEIMTGATTAGAAASARAWLVLVAWAVILPVLAVRLFRWE